MRLKRSIPCAVELDGVLYGFTGGRLDQISDIDDLPGDKWLISDMQAAISRVMTIESANKYAEILVQRKLQEAGEFDEPATVITHWKRKRGRNNTDIFFTAIPTRLWDYYGDQVHKKDDSILLLPLYMFLFCILKRIRSKQPVAVVFQHNRFADLLVGTKHRVYYAQRLVAYDQTEEELAALWENVRLDLGVVETEHRIRIEKVFFLNWPESAPQPEWPETTVSELYLIEQESVLFQDRNIPISFFKPLNKLNVSCSTAPATVKASFHARKWVYPLQALILLAILLLAGGWTWYQQINERLENDIATIRQEIASIQMPMPETHDPENYASILAFIKALDGYQRMPSFRQVVNDMSDASFADMKLDQIKLDYTNRAIHLEVDGRIGAPFSEAHKGYQRFLKTVKAKGYSVMASHFDTEISTSNISIKLEKTF